MKILKSGLYSEAILAHMEENINIGLISLSFLKTEGKVWKTQISENLPLFRQKCSYAALDSIAPTTKTPKSYRQRRRHVSLKPILIYHLTLSLPNLQTLPIFLPSLLKSPTTTTSSTSPMISHRRIRIPSLRWCRRLPAQMPATAQPVLLAILFDPLGWAFGENGWMLVFVNWRTHFVASQGLMLLQRRSCVLSSFSFRIWTTVGVAFFLLMWIPCILLTSPVRLYYRCGFLFIMDFYSCLFNILFIVDVMLMKSNSL